MRKLPPLNALRAFEAAARLMSFARAADELGVTPTAVSHQIRLLEEIMGQTLFRRRPRPIMLTEAGERLFPVLRDGLDRIAAAVDGLRADADSRPLVVATTTAFASRWLVPRLASLKNAIDLDLQIEASEKPVSLRSGAVDFAIRYRRTPVPDLECIELTRDRFIPVMSPESLASGFSVQTVADLARHTLIHFRWKRPDLGPPTWERYFAEARAADAGVATAAVTQGLRLSEEAHAIEAALGGQGVALVSNVLVRDDIASGALVRPVEFSIEGLGFYVTYLTEAPRRTAIERFLLWARDEMADATDAAGA